MAHGFRPRALVSNVMKFQPVLSFNGHRQETLPTGAFPQPCANAAMVFHRLHSAPVILAFLRQPSGPARVVTRQRQLLVTTREISASSITWVLVFVITTSSDGLFWPITL